jgi:hypothetical protein
MTKNVSWKAEPDDHDYPAAAAYLSLLAEGELVKQVVAELQAPAGYASPRGCGCSQRAEHPTTQPPPLVIRLRPFCVTRVTTVVT